MPQTRSKLEGQKFGRLLVVKKMNNDKWRHSRWLCKCDCGKEKIILGYNLQDGHTKSCGCLSRENSVQCNTKHGHGKRGEESKTYGSWKGMIERCLNPNRPDYHCYGGRGITIYQRWRKFENFLEDMGEAPEGYQIDRIDNDGNYCKENCKWSTRKEQNRNRRDNTLLTYDGKTQCLAALAEELDINYNTLCSRIALYNCQSKRR